ncbi:MAG TPA: helix-turn-helix domain-containing protein [Candidatus Udaeobacter sp.]|jgi:hypothetical protein|nr:helix-turn-helix domain-containing protein [Candidatus Udaeobacter sp.]
MQSLNGQTTPQTQHPKPKRHNGKHCSFADRQRIINGLANGDSKRAIARQLRVSNNTVTAVAEQEWQQVEARKQRLAAQAERNALLAGEQIAEALAQRKYAPSALVPVYGVSLDKALALRGDAGLTIRHQHEWHEITDDDIIAYAVALSHGGRDPNKELHQRLEQVGIDGFARIRSRLQQAQHSQKVIEGEIVQETHLLTEKTQSKKAR